jgi:hypothetical protein
LGRRDYPRRTGKGERIEQRGSDCGLRVGQVGRLGKREDQRRQNEGRPRSSNAGKHQQRRQCHTLQRQIEPGLIVGGNRQQDRETGAEKSRAGRLDSLVQRAVCRRHGQQQDAGENQHRVGNAEGDGREYPDRRQTGES